MALYVNTNVTSLNSQRKLTNATNSLNVSYQRLASGLRINSARDDAAGLQINDRLTAQINGLNQGNRNTNDGIALCQTVEGALDEVTNMLQRVRVLAVQSANGTYADGDRLALQEEVTQLSHEIFRIAQKTTFAGAQVLDGTPKDNQQQPNLVQPATAPVGQQGKIAFQVGANHNDTIDMDLSTSFKLSKMFETASGFVFCVPPRDLDGAKWQTVGTPVPGNTDATKYGIKAAELIAVNTAAGVSKEAENQALWEMSLRYTKAEDGDPEDDAVEFTGVIATAAFNAADAIKGDDPVSDKALARFSVSTAEFAQATLATIDKVIGFVDSKRAELGALQNRMEATVRNQSSIAENESDARSRIRDTDFAEETARMTSLNIIQNASQTILAQANQRPQIALQLLNAGQ